MQRNNVRYLPGTATYVVGQSKAVCVRRYYKLISVMIIVIRRSFDGEEKFDLVKDYLSFLSVAPGCTFADLAYHKSKSIALINFVSGGNDKFFDFCCRVKRL